jgi:DNA replication protein DnaC
MTGRELVGRDDDMALIRSFVEDVPARGGALLIAGDAGVGKSALAEAGASCAGGAGLRCCGPPARSSRRR